MRQASRLLVVLWPIGIAAVVAGFLILFGGEGEVTATQAIGRSIGGSFIFCGLIAWQRRPDNRTGQLMALTGFLFQAVPLVAEVSYTLSEVIANWWLVSLAALVLGFPSGRISARVDKLIIAGFAIGTGPVQVIWLLFRPVPETALLISADAGLADAIDRYQTGFNATMGLALAVVGVSRWLRAAPPLRRLMVPTLAGSLAVLVLGRRLVPALPSTLLVLVLAIAVSAIAGLEDHGVDVVGDIPEALPDPAIPHVSADDWLALVAPALGVLILSAEAVGVARALAVKHSYRVDPNRDLVAMGASNVFVGLSSGFVQSGGASQTMAAERAGGRTQLLLLVAAGLILLTASSSRRSSRTCRRRRWRRS